MTICKGVFPFIAHYLTYEKRFSFRVDTEDSAEVCDLSSQKKTDVAITPDSFDLPLIPPESRLSHKKTIRWLLRNGFIPTLQGKEIVFTPSFQTTASPCRTLDNLSSVQRITAPSPEILATANGSNITVWNPSTGNLLHTLQHNGVNSLAYFSDGTLLSAGGGYVIRWNSSTGKQLQYQNLSTTVIAPLSNYKFALVDGTYTYNNNKISIYAGFSVHQCNLQGHTGRIKSLAGLPGDLLASASEDRTIKIWDASKGAQVRTFQADTNGTMISLPNGLLASGGTDHSISLWNSATGELVRTLKGHTDTVNSFAYFPKEILISASNDKSVKLWDLHTGECIKTLQHDRPVLSLACSGELLATTCGDKTVKLWQLKTFSNRISSVQVLSQFDLAIRQAQVQLAEESTDAPQDLVCPLAKTLFQDPYITDCGHTFEKSAIDEHMNTQGTCPIPNCGNDIKTLVVNYKVKELAEAARNHCPVPAPPYLLIPDITLATSCIEAGKALAAKGEILGALDCFRSALKFTRRSEDYAAITTLFEKQNNPLKTSLAYLHLAKCQLREEKFVEVKATFEKIFQLKLSETLRSDMQVAYAFFLQMLGDHEAAFSLYQELAQVPLAQCRRNRRRYSGEHPKNKVIFYLEHALMCNPHHVETYEKLLPFYDPERTVHFCLVAFLHLFSTNPEKAKEFLEKARQSASDNPLVHLAYLSRLNKTQTEERLEIYRTVADITEKEEALIYLRKAVRSEQSSDFERYVSALLQNDELQKAEKVYLDWSDLLIKKRSYDEGIAVLDEAIEQIGENSPFFERLFTIFTELQAEKASYETRFKDTVRTLGSIYEREKKYAEAERVYRSSYEKFKEFESGCKLADMLQEQSKTSESVRIYYNLSEAAFYQKEFDKILKCFEKVKQFDRDYKSLTEEQKQFLFTQNYIATLFAQQEETL